MEMPRQTLSKVTATSLRVYAQRLKMVSGEYSQLAAAIESEGVEVVPAYDCGSLDKSLSLLEGATSGIKRGWQDMAAQVLRINEASPTGFERFEGEGWVSFPPPDKRQKKPKAGS